MSVEERRRIGRRVAEARHRVGLTQRELAEALGVTTRSIQHYESGAVVPYKHVRKLERVTRTRPGWILGDVQSSEITDSLEELRDAIQHHQTLIADHLEEMRRNTDRMRAIRETNERRRAGHTA